jgi:DNA processing protein
LAEQLSRSVTDRAIAEQEAAIAGIEGTGVRVVTILDDDYPFNLRLVFNRPPMLFVAGDLELGSRRAVAVVGTRQPSAAGAKRAEQLAHELVACGLTVVSGLARGIDTAAHGAALAAGGQTIAVMGTGINHIYPPENRELAAKIARHGALVSQFWPETGPTKYTFPLRNAVLSGLSTAVVVVEGPSRSGSSMQARIAFSQARPVFFVAGLSAEEDWAKRYLEHGLGRVIHAADEIIQATRFLTEAVNRGTLT